MGDILTSTTDYDAVRHALGVDSTLVSDALVISFEFLMFVEGEVKEQVTDWAAIKAANAQDYVRLRMAVAYWVAARLCGYLERDESRDYKVGPYSQRPTKVDWMAKARQLMSDAVGYLTMISTQSAAGRPVLFTRDGPTRSRTRVPGSDEWEAWLDRIEPTVIDWLEDGNTTT